MGWTSTHRESGISDREWFKSELGDQYEIEDCATVGTGFYAICIPAWPSAPRAIMYVATIRWLRDYYNFAYKSMDESMNPGEAACPARLLDRLEELVPEPPNEWAREWRERCGAIIAAKERAQRVPRGAVVHFAEPLHFGDGRDESDFVFVERSTFRRVRDQRRVRITSWRARGDWSVTRPPAGVTG